MAHEVETQWMGKMQFNALINGHTVVMDAPEKSGGEDSAPIPKPFVLLFIRDTAFRIIVGLDSGKYKCCSSSTKMRNAAFNNMVLNAL